MKKHLTSLILSIFFILVFGSAITFLFVNSALLCQTWGLHPWHWILIACISLFGLILSNVHRFRKQEEITTSQEKEEEATSEDFTMLFRDELETFRQENKKAFKAFLKVSILFWIHYWRKEKMKSLEETKKDVLKDLRREFMDVEGMNDLLKEISVEIAKYK